MKWINCENDEQVRTIQLPHQNAQNCFLWDREIRFLPTHNQQLHRIVLKIHVGNVQILVMSNNVCSLNAHAIIRNDQHAVSLNSAVVRKVKSYYSSYCKNSKNRKFEAPIYKQTLYAGVKHTQIRDPSLEIKFPTFDNEGIFFCLSTYARYFRSALYFSRHCHSQFARRIWFPNFPSRCLL